jgi:hypothetical protein
MSSFSNIQTYYVEDDFSGKCIVKGPCRFLGISVGRDTQAEDVSSIHIYDQGGTVGSAATPSAGNLVITLDFADEGNRNSTPYYMVLPGGSSVKMENGIVISRINTDDKDSMTVLYQQ